MGLFRGGEAQTAWRRPVCDKRMGLRAKHDARSKSLLLQRLSHHASHRNQVSRTRPSCCLLLAGEVDLVDWETLTPNDVDEFQLVQAQAAGNVRLIVLPSSTWEHLDFALFLR